MRLEPATQGESPDSCPAPCSSGPVRLTYIPSKLLVHSNAATPNNIAAQGWQLESLAAGSYWSASAGCDYSPALVPHDVSGPCGFVCLRNQWTELLP